MNVKVIKPTRKSSSESNTKLRVAAYCRVSTSSIEQNESLENQIKFYDSFLRNNPKYEFTKIYADQAISGSTDKRPEFQRLVKAVERHEVDLVYTKSISRFSRNITDLLNYVELFKANGVDIIFEEDNIQLSNDKSGLILSILGAIAQMELENISSHIRWVMQNKMLAGELVGGSAPLGYDYTDIVEDSSGRLLKKLVINEHESKVIKFIYSEYLSGKGLRRIVNELNMLNIPTKRGGIWHIAEVRYILTNEKYIGTLIQGKTIATGIHKRAYNDGIANLYVAEDAHPAIISKEDFEKVRDIMKSRVSTNRRGTTKNSKINAFTSKIKCSYCGKNYIRRIAHTNSKYSTNYWLCSSYAYHGKNTCPSSKSIREDDILEAYIRLVNYLLNDENTIFRISESEFNKVLGQMNTSDDIDKQTSIENNINRLLESKDALLDLYLEKRIDLDEYDNKRELIELDILELNKELEAVCIEESEIQARAKNIEEIRELISHNDIGGFDERIFERLIDYIEVGGDIEVGGKIVNDPKKLVFHLKYGELLYTFDTNTMESMIQIYTSKRYSVYVKLA